MTRAVTRILQPVDRTQSWYSFLFTAALVAVIMALIVQSDWRIEAERIPRVLFFLALTAAAEIFYVQLPQGKGRVSVGFATNLGAILVLPPFEAALVAAGGVLVANLAQRTAIDVIIFNAAQLWITAWTTAQAWHAMWQGELLLPLVSADLPRLFLALAACALLYYALNVSMVSFSIWLAYRLRPGEILAKNVLWGVPNNMALGSLGFIIAVLYISVGVYGVLLLWIPLLLARYSFQQYLDIRAGHLETIQALALALDAKDPYTRGHSERVAEYAVQIATEMRLSHSEVEMVRYAGVLHDIGKIGISDAVLNKVGRLTDAEFELIQAHTTIGAHVVKPVGFLRGVSKVIRHHHERYDGRGYPDGLKGEEIPLAARILAVADAFDAMTSDRVYRAGLNREEAELELLKGRGTQFDPQVVDVFVSRVLPMADDPPKQAAAMHESLRGRRQGDQLWRRFSEDHDGA